MNTDVQPAGGLSQEVSQAWKALSEADGLTPYIDYATPTVYDDFSGGVQRLLPDRLSPKEFVDDMQAKYAKFTGSL
jgi:raffinose/stachyose/melibiose transport system substrate-binding protein